MTRLRTFGRGSARISVSGSGGGGSLSRRTSNSPGVITVAVPMRPSITPTLNSSLPMRFTSSSRRPLMRARVALTKSSGWSNSRFTRYMISRVNIETRKKGDVVIVDFQGRLAVGVGDELLPRLIEQLLNEGNKKILLNLSDMDYIDSNGLGELVQSLKTSKRFVASLRLLKPQDRVRKTLRLTNLLPMFSVYDSEAEALKGFSGGA